MKTKVKLSNFEFIKFIKSIMIGNNKFTSDDLLPQKREIILFFDIIPDISIPLFIF